MSNLSISQLEHALSECERHRLETQRLSGVGFWELNHKLNTLYWSEEIFAIYGLATNEFEPSYEIFASLIYHQDRERVEEAFKHSVASGEPYDIRYRIKSGTSSKWIEAKGICYYDNKGVPERSVGIAKDISEIIDAQNKNEFLATHDVLTELPNRNLFSDRITMALRQAKRNQSNVAVLFIDIDNFKQVNDRFGHEAGDELLIALAHMLEHAARESDTFARIGGDEFLGLLPYTDMSGLQHAIERLKDSVDKVLRSHAKGIDVSSSIGIALYPQDGTEPDELIRHADHAMYEAKVEGKSRVVFFDKKQYLSNVTHHRLLVDIGNAISRDEMELYFQPKVSLKDGKHAGAEALLRWSPPSGVMPPTLINKAIAGTALEWELDTWVIRRVTALTKKLYQHDFAGPISLNINPRTLSNPNLPDYLAHRLTELDIIGSNIEIEILEVASINNFKSTCEILERCKLTGASVSLDDFGTGYSSITHFHSLPIDKVKIDRHFVKSLGIDSNSDSLIISILALAQANNTDVVAEGVETLACARALTEMGCDFAQGFAIASPMPVSAYIEWAKQWDAEAFIEQVKSAKIGI